MRSPKPLIGVIHLMALPGTPANERPLTEIAEIAQQEAAIYRDSGADGIIVENMHDVPYLRNTVGPEIVAAMSVVAAGVRKVAPQLPIGVQVLAAANHEALAIALAAELDFVRVEGFAFAHIADEGLIQSCAGDLLRYRKHIGAEHIQIWADVKKKHSAHAITSDVNLAETVRAVEFMRGDAVIVTGAATGAAPTLEDVRSAASATTLPVLLGSGVTLENVGLYWHSADGFIVGSFFKRQGHWAQPVDADRVAKMVAALASLGKS